MTNHDEILSAALDGECSVAELDRLLQACGQSPRLMQRYTRHLASREACGGTRFGFDSETFCASVMSVIEAPRPVRASHSHARPHTRVVAFRRRARSVLRPLGGLALAASVGALATFAAYRFDALPAFNQAVQQTAATGQHLHVASAGNGAVAPANAPAAEVRWSQLNPGTARQLDDYMMEHASYRTEQGMGSALNYARMAAQSAYTGGGSH